jgi:hypothetical protein
MKYFNQTRRLFAALMLSAIPLFAQIDTSSFTTQTNSFITLGLYIAAGACVLAFAFGIFKLIGRDLMAGISYIIGALIGGYIIGHALTWTQTITGQTVSGQ